jgi:hypothetical protein
MKIFNYFGNIRIHGNVSIEEKYYVYLYIDPRPEKNGEIFYVGKGKNRRYKFHIEETRETTKNPLKHNKIQKIIQSGYFPEIIIPFNKLSEKKAYKIEKDLISLLGTIKDGTGKLTNILKSGWDRKYDDPKNLPVYEKIREKQIKNWLDESSVYNSEEYRKKLRNATSGKNNPRYGDHRSWDEIHGVDKSNKLKKNRSQMYKGGKNPNAKKWKLTSPKGDVYEISGNLKKFCESRSIHLSALRKYFGRCVERPKIFHKRHIEKTINTIGWKLEEI